MTRSKDVALFGPPIPKGATFNKSKNFADFLLAKGVDTSSVTQNVFSTYEAFRYHCILFRLLYTVINGENAAHCSEKFATMATRTRQAYLKDLTLNYSSNTVLESSQKFCK